MTKKLFLSFTEIYGNGDGQGTNKQQQALNTAEPAVTLRGVGNSLRGNLDPEDERPVISLIHGNSSDFPRFRTSSAAEDAIIDALKSAKYNHYTPTVGLLPSRRSVSYAKFYHQELEHHCYIHILMQLLTLNDETIPNPAFMYEKYNVRKVAEMARKLGIIVIADETFAYMTFGSTPFVPVGVFGALVPVLTLGSISKRRMVPGWRMGWLVANDPTGLLQDSGIVEAIKEYLSTSTDPSSFTQAAITQILENTKEDFFSNMLNILREAADLCYGEIQDIPCITCPKKPGCALFMMVKLNVSVLEDINDDMDFCLKLAREESIPVLPGVAVGMKNWLRITFGIEPAALEVSLGRIKAFCQRHAKKQ
ncbi:hypothetical protein Tsubulata_013581 [Turnera subulata]|uniref:Aminotransferase class I/classII large domain-containing protein n=1 Tax=Turnera subulata TaxID=218843 RepID=A0A9Q0F267_9ROSI|nr:hypothetical protein Tsubulata_013581 [Turnera subulata]